MSARARPCTTSTAKGWFGGTLPLLLAQIADGAGAKFHVVALSLYLLHAAGLGAVSGFVASGLLGCVVALAVAAGTSRVVSGRTLMASAAGTLLAVRIGAYVVVAVGGAPAWLFAGQFVGSVAGTLLINCSKAQAPAERRARTLAWMNVANGGGGIVGAAGAGFLTSGWPTWSLVSVGVAGAVIATAPMLMLSRRSRTVPVSLRDQWHAARRVAGPVLLGAATFALVGGFGLLSNGLVAELFDARFVATATAAAVVGTWSAAATVGWFERLAGRVPAAVLWPALGVVPLALWAIAPVHLGVVLAAVGSGALLLGWLAVSVEAAVLERTGSAVTSALSLSSAVASLLSAGTVQMVPRLLDRSGHLLASGVLLIGLLVVALVAILSGMVRERSAENVPPSTRTPMPSYSGAAP